MPLFLGIFQSGEPKKRFSFSPEPEFSEFLTKWKAPMLTFVRIALAATEVQSILEEPATDEINMEDQTCLN